MIRFKEFHEACWDTHKQIGMKKKGNRMVPDCVPKNEETELEETWSKTGKEATHIPTGQKTYEYAKLDKEGRPTGKRHYRNEKGKVMGESVEESKDFSKYIMKATKTEPKIVRKTNPAGRTTDHVEYEVHGTLSSHKRTFKSKKEAEAYFNTVKEDVELDEAIKLNTKVKIHHPGKSYHGEVGHVGEIRHGLFKGAPKKYTVDYGDRKSIQLDKANIRLHKEEADLEEGAGGSETWEAGYKRRVVKTTSADHKEKGYNWRIKGKERPEISIKLYKEKPSQAEFNKQMRRVAGHEFGG